MAEERGHDGEGYLRYGAGYTKFGLPADLIASSFRNISKVIPVQLSYHLILPFQLSSAGVNKDERQFSLLYIISNDIGQISCLYTMLHKGQQDLVRQLLPEAQASQPPHNLLRHRSLPEGSRVTEDRELLLGNLYGSSAFPAQFPLHSSSWRIKPPWPHCRPTWSCWRRRRKLHLT